MNCNTRSVFFVLLLFLGIVVDASVEFCFNSSSVNGGMQNIISFYGICDERTSLKSREANRMCFVFTNNTCKGASQNYYDSDALSYYFGSLSEDFLRDVLDITDVEANAPLPKLTPPLPWPKADACTEFEFFFAYQEKCTQVQWLIAKFLDINANRIVVVSPCQPVHRGFRSSITFSEGSPSPAHLGATLREILTNEELAGRMFFSTSAGVVGEGEEREIQSSRGSGQRVFLSLLTKSSRDLIEKAMNVSKLSDWRILWADNDRTVMGTTENSPLLHCLLSDWPSEPSKRKGVYLGFAILFVIFSVASIIVARCNKRHSKRSGAKGVEIGSILVDATPKEDDKNFI